MFEDVLCCIMTDVTVGFTESQENNIEEKVEKIAQHSVDSSKEVAKYEDDLVNILRNRDRYSNVCLVECVRVLSSIGQLEDFSISDYDELFSDIILEHNEGINIVSSEAVTNIGYVVQKNPSEYPETSEAIYNVVGKLEADGDEKAVECLALIHHRNEDVLDVTDKQLVEKFESASEESVFIPPETVEKASSIL